MKPSLLDTAQISRMAAAGQKPRMGKQVSGTRIEYNYMSLAELISEAYNIRYSQVAGPDWIRPGRLCSSPLKLWDSGWSERRPRSSSSSSIAQRRALPKTDFDIATWA